MIGKKTFFFLISLSYSLCINAQTSVSGYVFDEEGSSIHGVSIGQLGQKSGTSSDSTGYFELAVYSSDSFTLVFSHIAFQKIEKSFTIGENNFMITLKSRYTLLDEVEVSDVNQNNRNLFGKVNPASILSFPAPTGDFLNFVKTLPGVVSNNDLSSSYSVRGGNYNENMIMLNGMPVYRPFLIANGQQEGLSFMVPEFVDELKFYSGAWTSKYGNKLSSVLEIEYKTPAKSFARLEVGLLGNSFSAGYKKNKIHGLISYRRKTTKYLLNGLETKGEYRPDFNNFQNIISFSPNSKLDIDWITVYSRNNYNTIPSSRITEFGTSSIPLRLFVAFEGQENVKYNTFQSGLRINYQISPNWTANITVSGVKTLEEEKTNVEGGYRLCDVDKDPTSADFNDCISTRGVGSQFKYARNSLDASIYDVLVNNQHQIELISSRVDWGFQLNEINVDDFFNEYSFIDSAAFVTDFTSNIEKNELAHHTLSAYVQTTSKIGSKGILIAGVRVNRPGITKETLVAPRLSVQQPVLINSEWAILHFATGIHYQSPFYRELRGSEGVNNNIDLKSQASFHLSSGIDLPVNLWNRKFNFVAEGYYKYLWNTYPYDIDNVKIRYLSEYEATAFATGIDTKFGGEFISGTESWFSLSFLKTNELIPELSSTPFRRPSDQRLTFGVFFQDYFPQNPDMKVAINMQLGSGLPFGPPNTVQYRTSFKGETYKRIDIGFIRDIKIKKIQSSITAEVLNLLGADNTITYSWIEDVNGLKIAVPNALSARFFNFKMMVSL